MRYNVLKKITPFVFLFIFFVGYFFANAQTSSSDAIAIRILPNPMHYSPARWYAEQKFNGKLPDIAELEKLCSSFKK